MPLGAASAGGDALRAGCSAGLRGEESRARARPAPVGLPMPAAVATPGAGACPGRGGRRGVRCCPRGASVQPRLWVRARRGAAIECQLGARASIRRAHVGSASRHQAHGAHLAAESRVPGGAVAQPACWCSGACASCNLQNLLEYSQGTAPLVVGRRLLHSRPLPPPPRGAAATARGASRNVATATLPHACELFPIHSNAPLSCSLAVNVACESTAPGNTAGQRGAQHATL